MSEAKSIRVLIVDDHSMVRSGLTNFIYGFEWMELVGEARNGGEAVAFCATHEVDVVLMDLLMPIMDGCEATRRILERGGSETIIILTSFHEAELVEDALKAGATSYLLKNVAADDLAVAIQSAYDGRSVLAPEATDALIQATRQRPRIGADLTDRERETLALLVQGLPNAEIADRLFISMPTVKFHVTNIFTKIGARNRVEAVTIALNHDLVEKPR